MQQDSDPKYSSESATEWFYRQSFGLVQPKLRYCSKTARNRDYLHVFGLIHSYGEFLPHATTAKAGSATD